MGLSRAAGRLFRERPLLLGPASMGWEVSLAALCVVVAVQVLSPRRTARFAAVVGTACVLLALQAVVPSPWLHLALNIGLAGAFVAARGGAATGERRSAEAGVVPGRLRMWTAAPLSILGLALALALWPENGTPALLPRADSRPKVLFWEEGLLEMTLPVEGRYGEDALGVSFGYLPKVLEMLGYETATAGGVLTRRQLDGVRVLVVINLREAFSPQEHEAVWRFVEDGGSLLVLGDHTDVGGTRSPLNELLAPSGIRFRFDSAIQDGTRGWRDVLLPLPHPATSGIRSAGEAGIVVGASLDLPWNALPLIVARRGISDAGDEANAENAYLGNMRYDPGEQRGDLVLAALAERGRGRVMVFGDTSTFQTSEVAQSWRTIAAVFRHLAAPHRGLPSAVRLSGAFLLLIALGAGLWGPSRTAFLSGAALLGSLAVLAAGAAGPARVRLGPAPRPRVAWVEASHFERIGPETWFYPDTIGGLLYNLMRAGRNPLLATRFDDMDLRPGDTLLVVAPVRPFRRAEVDRVLEFCRRGGSVLIAVGWEERHGSLPLLDALGIEVEATPLGGAPDAHDTATGQAVRFHEAWPVNARHVPGMGKAEVLLRAYERPVVVRRALGHGAAVVIGDSGFFSTRNLEDSDSYVPENVAYFPRLLSLAAGDGSSPEGGP